MRYNLSLQLQGQPSCTLVVFKNSDFSVPQFFISVFTRTSRVPTDVLCGNKSILVKLAKNLQGLPNFFTLFTWKASRAYIVPSTSKILFSLQSKVTNSKRNSCQLAQHHLRCRGLQRGPFYKTFWTHKTRKPLLGRKWSRHFFQTVKMLKFQHRVDSS